MLFCLERVASYGTNICMYVLYTTYKSYGCQNRFGKALNFGNDILIKHVVSDNEERNYNCIGYLSPVLDRKGTMQKVLGEDCLMYVRGVDWWCIITLLMNK